jgi:hypothetical protein
MTKNKIDRGFEKIDIYYSITKDKILIDIEEMKQDAIDQMQDQFPDKEIEIAELT